jgi:hypothetical protein
MSHTVPKNPEAGLVNAEENFYLKAEAGTSSNRAFVTRALSKS